MKDLEKKRDSREEDNDKDCPRRKRDARNKGHIPCQDGWQIKANPDLKRNVWFSTMISLKERKSLLLSMKKASLRNSSACQK